MQYKLLVIAFRVLHCIGHVTCDSHASVKLVIWRNREGRWETWWDQLEHSVIPFLLSVRGPFFTSRFGQRSNKTISEYGNPDPALMQTPPPSLLYLPSSRSLSAAGPRREAAKFILSSVVPLRWRRGPRHAAADVLGEGPWKDVGGTLLFLQHSISLFLWKDRRCCPFRTGKVKWMSKQRWDVTNYIYCVLCWGTNLRYFYFTWVCLFSATLYFYFTTILGKILHFLFHYISLITSTNYITESHE